MWQSKLRAASVLVGSCVVCLSQILPVEQLQRERFKLQAQEYPYFLGVWLGWSVCVWCLLSWVGGDDCPACPHVAAHDALQQHMLSVSVSAYLLQRLTRRGCQHCQTSQTKVAASATLCTTTSSGACCAVL